MKNIIFGFFVLMGASAHALPNCVDIFDPDAEPIGYKCISNTGHVFEKVERKGFGGAWKDPTGLIWSSIMYYPGTPRDDINRFYDAWDACADRGAYLPLVSEGIEVGRMGKLPHNSSYELWTSEVDRDFVKTIAHNPISGGYGVGLQLRGGRADTICVDDSLVKVKNPRPAKPPVEIVQGDELESPIRDAKGRLLRLTKAEARQYCNGINKRLPTFQEFVDYAVGRGAKGLVSTEPSDELFNTTFWTVRGTYIFDRKGYIWNEPALDDIEPYYWIEDDADLAHYPPINDAGKLVYRYDSFLFNRANGIGLFFIHHSSNREEFVCTSQPATVFHSISNL